MSDDDAMNEMKKEWWDGCGMMCKKNDGRGDSGMMENDQHDEWKMESCVTGTNQRYACQQYEVMIF